MNENYNYSLEDENAKPLHATGDSVLKNAIISLASPVLYIPAVQFTFPLFFIIDEHPFVLAALLILQFAIVSVIAWIFGAKATSEAKAIANAGYKFTPKQLVGKILGIVGKITGIVTTVLWSIYALVFILIFLTEIL
ncbi:MAG: hypothetical protein KBS44_03185 [Clostridiales bacterium]|nr:hypothetical protein [Candidatus Coliplasma equi]